MTEKVSSIAKLGVHPHDRRRVWSKYDEIHTKKTVTYIEEAITKHTIQGILEIRDEVVARFLTEDHIVFGADSYLTLFDRIWERVAGEFVFSTPEEIIDPAPLQEFNEQQEEDGEPILTEL